MGEERTHDKWGIACEMHSEEDMAEAERKVICIDIRFRECSIHRSKHSIGKRS